MTSRSEKFRPEVVIHPVTGETYQRSEWSSRRVVRQGTGGNAGSLAVHPDNFPFPFLHSEVAKILYIENMAIKVRRLVQTVTGK